jgi:hypothetical protein
MLGLRLQQAKHSQSSFFCYTSKPEFSITLQNWMAIYLPSDRILKLEADWSHIKELARSPTSTNQNLCSPDGMDGILHRLPGGDFFRAALARCCIPELVTLLCCEVPCKKQILASKNFADLKDSFPWQCIVGSIVPVHCIRNGFPQHFQGCVAIVHVDSWMCESSKTLWVLIGRLAPVELRKLKKGGQIM